jgi:protein gp37
MENSKIQWTDATVNFWSGCKKISAGCKFCYMYRDKERYGKKGSDVVQVSHKTVNKTLKSLTKPSKIFTCSWSDFFLKEADQWREAAWDVIRRHPQHQWQILTKRPERIKECLPPDWGTGWKNVWLGVSIENEETKHRLLTLHELKSRNSTFITFVSYEPALGELNLLSDKMTAKEFKRLDWMIVGGESGNDVGKYRYRPSKMEWYTSMIDQCQKAEVKVFVKQLGTYLAKKLHLADRHGGNIQEWDKIIQIREFPKINGKGALVPASIAKPHAQTASDSDKHSKGTV